MRSGRTSITSLVATLAAGTICVTLAAPPARSADEGHGAHPVSCLAFAVAV